MRGLNSLAAFGAVFCLISMGCSYSYAASKVEEHSVGNQDAPITVQDISSFGCSHCATFYRDVFPELKKRYVDTGKVRFIFRDFPNDGPSLKAALMSDCMPKEQYFPFVNTIYANQNRWVGISDPDRALIQLAKLAGLSDAKVNECINNKALMDNIVAERIAINKKYDIKATPTFVINDGAERLDGAQSISEFAAIFDRLLATKQK